MRLRSILMISLLLPLAPALTAAQSARLVLPDFSALAKKATESVNISLDPSLVSTHDRKQHSNVDIFVNRKSAHSEGGMAIITSTPREFTIVNIVGSIDLAKLEQLQGRFGVPRIDVPRIDVPKGDVPKGDAGH